MAGPKHSGKTCAGKELAILLSENSACMQDVKSFCKFIDIDELILERTGKSPRQLFLEGLETFQTAEAEAINSILFDDQLKVVATGGGIIDNSEAIAALKKIDSMIVYLNVDADCAWNRIFNSPAGIPPFLQTENPQETHRVLHERRAAAYLQLADIVIEAENKTPEKIASEISERLIIYN